MDTAAQVNCLSRVNWGYGCSQVQVPVPNLIKVTLEEESSDQFNIVFWDKLSTEYVCLPPNSYVEILTPKVMVLGGGAFEK